MKSVQSIPYKIFTLQQLLAEVKRWRLKSQKIVFTNGVFDILHKGHIASLSEAASFGNILITAVNSDESVKKLKGPGRPINDENARCMLLAALVVTDAVILFEEDTPLELIKAVMPDVLVKGGDYTVDQIAGANEVLLNGGVVKLTTIVEGFSTTDIIQKMKDL